MKFLLFVLGLSLISHSTMGCDKRGAKTTRGNKAPNVAPQSASVGIATALPEGSTEGAKGTTTTPKVLSDEKAFFEKVGEPGSDDWSSTIE